MVDFNSYLEYGPKISGGAPMGDLRFSGNSNECHCTYCSSNRALREHQKWAYDNADKTATFEETQYLICPPRVLGYDLKGRAWVELDVEKVKPIIEKTSTKAFDRLELKYKQKKLIKYGLHCLLA